MTDDTLIHHEINYIEFQVRDMDAAKRFYQSAFNWSFSDYGPGYAGIKKQGGGEVGGLRLTDEVSTGGPLVILYSRDLGSSLESVTAAGGSEPYRRSSSPVGADFTFGIRVAMNSPYGLTNEISLSDGETCCRM